MERKIPRGVSAPKTDVTSPALLALDNLPDSGFVTVASKLPNGLVLQLSREEEAIEAVPATNGHKVVKVWRKFGDRYILNKARLPLRMPEEERPEHKVVGGFALTENIPVEFWKEWVRQNKDAPYVKNKLVFAYVDANDVEARSREFKTLRNGMEPIRQEQDPRMPKDIRKASVKEIQRETATA